MSEDYKKYLRPDVVSRLGRLDLIARLVVEGFITGLHRSPYHGFSVEFSEYRPYIPGESIKNIDWKVYGRTERHYVKQYEEETNLKSYLLLDCSASMEYTSHRVTKLQYATWLAAALGYLMIHQRDAVGLLTFDEKIKNYYPPRSMPSYLHILLKELGRIESGKSTNISETFHELAERIKRRGLILIFSDLYDDPQSVLAALKHFRHKKHEVIVFHLLDPQEIDFDFHRETTFIDLETGDKIQAPPWQIRSEYKDKVQSFLDNYRTQCHANRIDYVPINTSRPFDVALLHFLAKRKKMGG